MAYPVLAEKKDTVSYFSPKKGYFHYTRTDIVSQFARFPIKSSVLLHSVTVTLTGKTGKGLIHFYGNEGGASLPILKQELIESIPIEKTKDGVQSITITLKDPLQYKQSQFFIGVDNLTDSVYLVTDRFHRKPKCTSNDSKYYYQVIQLRSGKFEYGDFAYSIQAVTEPLPSSTPVFQLDTAVFTPNTVATKEDYRNICVSDLNGDGYDDILANGRLYSNHNGTFTDETVLKKLPEKESRSITIDFNNDGRLDILSFPQEGDSLGSILYMNTTKGFIPQRFNISNLRTITSLSAADVNSDGFVDVFVGQYNEKEGIRSKILLNSNGEMFRDNSSTAQMPSLNYSRGSFLADLDADGKIELFVAGAKQQSNYLGTIETFSGLQVRSSLHDESLQLGIKGIGGMPSDINGNSEQNIVFTNTNASSDVKSTKGIEALHSIKKSADRPSENTFLPYLERASGGVCADINNDGLTDIFLPTTCSCNSARLYLGAKDGFTDVTEEYGLTGIRDARDGVFFDADNNGTLDLVVFSGENLRFYRNTGNGGGGYVHLALKDRVRSGNVGAQIISYSSGEKQRKFLVSGRGMLMQDPTSVVIGMGDNKQIDSVIVIWNTPDKTTERFGPYNKDANYTLEKGLGTPTSTTASSQCITDATAFPNPFSTQTEIHFMLSKASSVSVTIYSFGGVQLAELHNGMMESGAHSIVWNGTDKLGSPATTGLYLYKIKTDGCEVFGQMHLQR